MAKSYLKVGKAVRDMLKVMHVSSSPFQNASCTFVML